MRTARLIAVTVVLVLCIVGLSSAQVAQTPLLGASVRKYVTPLPTFVGARVNGATTVPLTVTMKEFQSQVLPAGLYPLTTVWGYEISDGTAVFGPSYPAFTIVNQRNIPTRVQYLNHLVNPTLQPYLSVDQTLHWADPYGLDCPMRVYDCVVNPASACCQPYAGPVPAVVHLHGGELPPAFDGGPDMWFTPEYHGLLTDPLAADRGPGFVTNVYAYPNSQEATTLWYHDHALGATRLNVYGGMAGFYFLKDPLNEPVGLPGDPALGAAEAPYEVEIVFQDRMFDTAGQLYYPAAGINPDVHPFWLPEFFGDVIVVNGKSWPFLNVTPRKYRFRLLNGSNARFYNIWLVDSQVDRIFYGPRPPALPPAVIDAITQRSGPRFTQIGTDQGYLDAPVQVRPLLLGPGERADVIIDFSRYRGQTFVLRNNAATPFPAGVPVDPLTAGQLMQFRVSRTRVADPSVIPANLRPNNPMVRLAPTITPTTPIRRLTLNEVMGMAGPLESLLNNTKWHGQRPTGTPGVLEPVPGSVLVGANWTTELPRVGATEVWEIVNMTADAHPIHLHLVQVQILNRQAFNALQYTAVYDGSFPGGVFIPGYGPPLPYGDCTVDPVCGGNPDITPYLLGAPAAALPNENGWKDTVIMYPGEVTRIAVRLAPQDTVAGGVAPGQNLYPFIPTGFPGYVWHCHILEHEDNEMMRPMVVAM